MSKAGAAEAQRIAEIDGALPGQAVPYVVRYGDGLRHNAAGQIVYTLAGGEETAGGFGAMLGELPFDPVAIPLHYHEREHDTWLCTRGKVQVWCGEESRVLTPGDFAYVRPGDIHSYRSVAPRSAFFGIVSPGGWEKFFVDAGEVWGMLALPPEGHPFDFRRMGAAMAKHDVHPVKDASYAEATPIGVADRALPEGNESYFLEAGHGRRTILRGHLATALMTARQTDDHGDIRVIEAPRGAAMPALHHARTTVFLFVLAGSLAVTIDGAEVVLTDGDGVNLPAGTRYATRVASGVARWVAATANGNGGELWDRGMPTRAHAFPGAGDEAADTRALGDLAGLDVTLD